jgi:hypothetical protein
MTFLQRKGGTKGIKQEVRGGKTTQYCVLWEFGTNPDEALGFFDSVVGI